MENCPCTLDAEIARRRRGEQELGIIRYRSHEGDCMEDPEPYGVSEGMRILAEWGCVGRDKRRRTQLGEV